MAKPKCSNCFFAVVEEITHVNLDKKTFACHRHPPTQAANQRIPNPAPYPIVYEDDWCGEYKRKK